MRNIKAAIGNWIIAGVFALIILLMYICGYK